MKLMKTALALGVLSALSVNSAHSADAAENARLTFTLISGDKVTATARGDSALSGIRVLNENNEEEITSIFTIAGQTYVIPADVQPLIDEKRVDMELFNITKLHQSGYDDESTQTLPVIVEFKKGALRGRAAPRAFASARMTSEIEAIDSAVYHVEKENIAVLFKQLSKDGSIEGVWLDAFIQSHKVDSQQGLTPTVPLTGANGYFARNYDGSGITVAVLDSGYDVEHADLAGQVTVSKDFSNSRNGVDDLNGHGTHVASTIAGTGAESGGLWAGVAPGAKLIVGKVLGNTGGGSTSGILQGMQWAVDQGADIVSMSLGGSGTSCSGPLVNMVEALSDQSLFVISAGNSYTRETVGLPGCAPSALTVAAIDRNDDIASFSSRGPSPDGHSAKPDIASQGVNVVAAASGGYGETAYRTLSGTSMAAPHVSGGAAIAMQARPELSPKQIKDLLTSSSKLSREHVLEQGAGPMDINQAVIQAVISPANIELGQFDSQSTDEVQKSVTLTNTSDEDVTFILSLHLMGEDGHTLIPFRLARLGDHRVTIPANGSVDVPIRIFPDTALRDGAYGTITGRISGFSLRNPGQRINVPVSMWIKPDTATLTFDLTDHRGLPAESPSRVYIINEEDDWGRLVSINNGQASLEVDQGRYTFVANIMTYDNDTAHGGLVETAAQMSVLNKRVNGNTVITLDSREAKKVEFIADKPLTEQGYSFGFTYALDDAKVAKLAAVDLAPDYVKNMYLWSQGYDDRFTSYVTTRAIAPQTTITAADGTNLEYLTQGQALSFHGEGQAQVVAVGEGGYDTDWTQFDLTGKIALIAHPYYLTSYMMKNAQAQGAIGVLFYRPGTVGRYKTGISGAPSIPAVSLSAEQGQYLADLIEQGQDTITWSGTAPERTPYIYSLQHINTGLIKSAKARFKAKDLEHIETSYYSQDDTRNYYTDVMARIDGSDEFYSTGSFQMVQAPIVRDEYFGAYEASTWTNIVMPQTQLRVDGGYFDGPRLAEGGKSHETSWFKAPRGGSLSSQGTPIASRDTNVLRFDFSNYGDSAGHDAISGIQSVAAYGVLTNGERVYLDSGLLSVPNEPTEITLELRYYPRGVGQNSLSLDHLGSLYNGKYTFTTDASMQGYQPVLMPVIDIPLSLGNTMAVGEQAEIVLSGVMDGLDHVNLNDVSLQYGYGQECMFNGVPGYMYCPTTAQFDESMFQEAQVRQNSQGQWVAIVPNQGQSGDFVHLRVRMTSEQGSTAEQLTMRAYKLK